MTRQIESEGRELLIQVDGRVKRSPVPDAFSPAMFRHIVAGVDLLYRQKGRMPTVSEVMSSWEDFDLKTIRQAFATPEFAKALEIRGIPFDTKTSLTAEQLYAIQILQDPTSKKTTSARLADVGIPIGKYRAWMRNPIFARAMHEQAEQNLGDAPQMALNRLIANAEAGDQRAIEKILEISGRWNPQQQEVQNARTVVLTVMEVIQEVLADDPEKLNRVLDKVRGKVQVLSIQNSIGQ